MTETPLQNEDSKESPSTLPLLNIPSRVRSFVYVIGMIGFPIVVATYVLVVLTSDLKQIDKALNGLSTRISERPMAVDRSTDFIIYITDSLQADIHAGLPALVNKIDFSITSTSNKEELARKLTIIHREIDGYIRPIVRKHQRFAERFPTVGGNLGSLFILTAPAEKLDPGETEAHLRGKTIKDFSEALSSMWMNNITNFGNIDSSLVSDKKQDMPRALAELLGIESPEPKKATLGKTASILIDKDIFLRLALNGSKTATIVLRDQMLTKLKIDATVRD